MGHDSRAGTKLALELRREIEIDGDGQIQRDDRRLREVRGEQIAVNEGDSIGDTAFLRDLARPLDEARVDLDADTLRSILLRRDDEDAAVSRTQVVHHVVSRDTRELQHRVGHPVRRRREIHVGRTAWGRLRGHCR
jgi:hypothetical protein